MRAAAWILGLVTLGVAQFFMVRADGAEYVQGRVYVLTAVVAAIFIALYSRDPWWRTAFGRSLMLIAIAILLVGVSVILFRFVGPDYPGREVLIVVAADATLCAMCMRTAVLWVAQRKDRRDKLQP